MAIQARPPVLAAAAAVAVALASGPAAYANPSACGPNLVTNGSFEKGTTPGEYLTIKTGAPDLDGWTVVHGTVDIVGTLWPASDGDRSIDMDGTSFGTISQDIATKPGDSYALTFDLSGNAYGPPTVKTLQVSAGDENVRYAFDVSKRPGRSMGWQTKSWTFKATAKTTTLRFESLDTENGYFGPVIDAVSVRAVCNS